MKSTARLRVGVFLVLIVVALASSLWAVWRTGDWEGLALNFGTEMAGAVVTYLLLELVIGRTERREAEREAEKKEREEKKANLIAQMGSRVNDVAIAAAEELRRHSWLYDGALQGADLSEANLQGANLYGANLEGAKLSSANLQGAELHGTNLQTAILYEADLQGTNLFSANLRGANLQWALLFEATLFRANLFEANLFGAGLQGAELSGANLQRAILQGAILEKAKLHKDTTLPDGTKWTPDTDMARFTDPDHPDFWHPEEPS